MLAMLVIPAVYPAFFKTAVRLHLEAQAMLDGHTTISLKKNKVGDGSDGDADAQALADEEALAAMSGG